MKMVSTKFTQVLIGIILLLLLSTSKMFGQGSDCENLTDPSFGFFPEIDPCCGIQDTISVCEGYDLLVLPNQLQPNQNGEYEHVSSFEYDGVTYNAPSAPMTAAQIAEWINSIIADNQGTLQFEVNSDGQLCAIDGLNGDAVGSLCFGAVSSSIKEPDIPEDILPYQCLDPITLSFVVMPCDIEMPDISAILSGDPVNVPNLTLMTTSNNEQITTQDLMGGFIDQGSDYEGPSAQDIGILANALFGSGIMGSGCNSFLNCIDLEETVANLLDENLNEALFENTEFSIFLSENYGAQSQELGEDMLSIINGAVNNQGNGTLAGFVNNSLGLNLPDNPCPQGFVPLQEEPSEVEKSGGKFEESFNALKSASENADADFFSSTISGLGMESTIAPTPSAMEAIQTVQAGVDLYNGSASVSIPLYTLSANDLSMPISINSSSNGVKVNDIGTLVGQNWDLNAGSVVSRVVKGLPDEYSGTTRSTGVGRVPYLQPRFQIPSSVGFELALPGLDESTYCNLQSDIVKGILIAKHGAGVVEVRFYWSPLNPVEVSIVTSILVASITVPPPGVPIPVRLDVGFKVGLVMNDSLGNVYFDEQGLGFFGLSDSQLMGEMDIDQPLTNALVGAHPSEVVQGQLLNSMHGNRNMDDIKFFVDRAVSWEKVIQALSFSEVVYETKKLDTEPDEYYFSAGSYSGKFSFNLDGEPIIYPDQDLKVEFEKSTDPLGMAHISEFTITTPDGKRYTYGSAGDFYAVDFTESTNYYLPNYYTYDELDNDRTKFGQAKVSVSQISYLPFIGKDVIMYYGDTYNRNYRISEGIRHTSTWRLVKVESLLSKEELELTYTKREGLRYYADKSYSHSFPNFAIEQKGIFSTIHNNNMNPLHPIKTKWESGRAEFSYSATELSLDRWDLKRISTQRGEYVEFTYGDSRGEIVGDSVCTLIKVYRNENLYKGWELKYTSMELPEVSANCDGPLTFETENSPISIPTESLFQLGDEYSMKWFEYNSYFFFNFRLGQKGCLSFPVRLNFSFVTPKVPFYKMNSMGEFGGLMLIKSLNKMYNEAEEEAIFNAEGKRTFLTWINEIDKNEGTREFVYIKYNANEHTLPKRFSLNQDLFGYFNDNEESGSPLPSIQYTSIFNTEVNSTQSGVEKHFGFYLTGKQASFYKGHNELPDLDRAIIGSIDKIYYASGAMIEFAYGLNQLPSGVDGAGIRVRWITEHPELGIATPKTTYYDYGEPTTVNNPIRIFQSPNNYYYRISQNIEQRVSTTSGFQNSLISNGSNHVGYGVVTESWQGIGSVEHWFTTPENFTNVLLVDEDSFGPFIANFGVNQSIFNTQRVGALNLYADDYGFIQSDLSAFGTPNEELPPANQFPEGYKFLNFLYGKEYKTEVFGLSGNALVSKQKSEYDYRVDARLSGALEYTKSTMYQDNFVGDYITQFLYRTIKHYLPLPQGGLLGYIADIIVFGGIEEHPYKKINRDYFVTDFRLPTANLTLRKSTVEDYHENNEATCIVTDYIYDYNWIVGIPSETKVTYSNCNSTPSLSTTSINIFPSDQGNIEELSFFPQNTIDHLENIGYKMPVAQKSYLNGNLVSAGFTALSNFNGRVVPMANYTVRDLEGTLAGHEYELVGVFGDYDDLNAGKPRLYQLAMHGASFSPPADFSGNFFEPIELVWNNQLQLTSRKYLDFETKYGYNDYFELIKTIDPDKVVTSYAYDSWGRLNEVRSLNDRQITNYEYNIALGDNFVQTRLFFDDGSFPDQVTTQYTDGMGKPIRLVRDNDGAILNETLYDNFFRAVQTNNLATGETYIEHESSPIPRRAKVTDAVGNVTESWTEGDPAQDGYIISYVKDANDIVTRTYSDGLGRTSKAVSGEGGVTEFDYDNYGRLKQIINPIGEVFDYKYNELGKIYESKVPGSSPHNIWWDEAFRPAAASDGNGVTQFFEYDDYNRIVNIFTADQPDDPESISGVGFLLSQTTNAELLLENTYVDQHTWLESSNERLLEELGFGGFKEVDYMGLDDIGRPALVLETYGDHGGISTNFTYTDAGIVPVQSSTINSVGGQVEVVYEFSYDDLLRPDLTSLSVNGGSLEPIARLQYNSKDQVKTKYLGPDLQKVDYLYDASGRLTHINTPGEMECYLDQEFCAYELTFVRENTLGSGSCNFLTDIKVNGNLYNLDNPFNILNVNLTPPVADRMEAAIETALDEYGLFGEASVIITYNAAANEFEFMVTVTNSNASSLELVFSGCVLGEVFTKSEDCCEPGAAPAAGDGGLAGTGNPDLFYEHITYKGLDISRIDMGSNCMTGIMRYEYKYDANHRLTDVRNTFFMPEPVVDLFSSNYTYDLAGNLLTLKRFGLEDPTVMGTSPVLIDDLDYGYYQGSSVLNSVTDITSLPQGFAPSTSTYDYDGAGNLDLRTDDGIELTIGYNLLNLPGTITHPTDGDIRYGYTYGGHKFLKETELADEEEETRLYLGGAEFVNGQPESYYHGEGRVALTGDKPAFQYKLTDHLGNTMVLFEDRDENGIITTESNPAENEVLQRNFYYAFGLPMQGPWNHAPADPDMPYLYNGKELEGELGLGWYAYGFRYYDASIGRFVGVDPIAEHFPHVSSFNYAENRVITGIDLWGLQYVDVTSGEAVGPVDPHNSKTTIAEEYDVNGNGEQDYYLPSAEVTASRLGGESSPQIAPGQTEVSGSGATSSDYSDSAVNITGIVAGLDVYHLTTSPPRTKTQIGYLAKNNKIYSGTHRPNGATGPRSAWRPAYSYAQKPWVQPRINLATQLGRTTTVIGVTTNLYNYANGDMGVLELGGELAVSGAMAYYPSPYTFAFGIGWETGRIITKFEWYQRNVHAGRYYFNNPHKMPSLPLLTE